MFPHLLQMHNNKTMNNDTLPAVVVVTIVVVAVTAVTWSYYHSYQDDLKGNNKKHGTSTKEEDTLNKDINEDDDDEMMLLQESFQLAVDQVRDKCSTQWLSNNEDKLMLYGLYKQVMNGNAPKSFSNVVTSSWDVMTEYAKYKSWIQYNGMNPIMAMNQYINKVEELQNNNATTAGSKSSSTDDDGGGFFGCMVGGTSSESSYDPTTANLEEQFLYAASQNDIESMEALVVQWMDRNNNNDNNTATGSTTTTTKNAADADHSSLLLSSLIHYKDNTGQTALHLAVDKGCMETVQWLLQRNANPNDSDSDHISILQTAVMAEQVTICELLIRYGANLDQPDIDGDTPRSCIYDNFSDNVPLMEQFQQILDSVVEKKE